MSIYDVKSFEQAWKAYNDVKITDKDIIDAWKAVDESDYIVGIDTVTYPDPIITTTHVQRPVVNYCILSDKQRNYLEKLVSEYKKSMPLELLKVVQVSLIEGRYKISDKDKLNSLKFYVKLKKHKNGDKKI